MYILSYSNWFRSRVIGLLWDVLSARGTGSYNVFWLQCSVQCIRYIITSESELVT